VNTETVYLDRREAGLVMTSVHDRPSTISSQSLGFAGRHNFAGEQLAEE